MSAAAVIGRFLRSLADGLAPLAPTPRAPVVVRAPCGVDHSSVTDSALSLMDDGVEAFVLFRVVREDNLASVKMSGSVRDLWWPALAQTMSDVAQEAQRV